MVSQSQWNDAMVDLLDQIENEPRLKDDVRQELERVIRKWMGAPCAVLEQFDR